jgi:hypothetical protein
MEQSYIFIMILLLIISASCSIKCDSVEEFGLMRNSVKNMKILSKCGYKLMKTGTGMVYDFWTLRWI